MDTIGLETGSILLSSVVVAFVLVPVLFFIVFEIVAVIFVATALVYVKAGRPAWLSLIPLYSFVELLDIVGLSVWWAIPVPVLLTLASLPLFYVSTGAALVLISLLHLLGSIGMIALMLFVHYRLAEKFGQSGWYTLGYTFLPFVFFPMLAFGPEKYKSTKSRKKNTDLRTRKFVVTGLLVASVGVMMTACVSLMVSTVTTYANNLDAAPASPLCYIQEGSRVYLNASKTQLNTDPHTFSSLTPLYTSESGNCYGKDAHTVFFNDVAIVGADASTFHLLDVDAYYAADATRIYRGAKVIEDAKPSTFVDLGHGYAKGKNTVFYFSTGLGSDNTDSGDLITIFGADVKTFKTVDGNDQFDAQDKNHIYQFGAVVSTSTPTR